MTYCSLPTFPWPEPKFPTSISNSSVTSDHFPQVLNRLRPISLSKLFQPWQSISDTCLIQFMILNYAHMPSSRYQHCDATNMCDIISSLLCAIFASCSPQMLLSYLLTYGVIGDCLRIALPSRHIHVVSWSGSGHGLNVINITAARCGG